MPKAKVKPIVVKVGNVRVKIYRRQRKKGEALYPVFDVADQSSGTRRFLSYADETEARTQANEIAVKLANREGAVLALTSANRAAYSRALELLKPTGVPLELAAAAFADAHNRLSGRSLSDAVTFYVRRHPASLPRRSVQELFDDLLAAKKADGSRAI